MTIESHILKAVEGLDCFTAAILQDRLDDGLCLSHPRLNWYLSKMAGDGKYGFLDIVPVSTEHGCKNLPSSHFKSFYEVPFGDSGKEAFIRLDVLYEENPYNSTRLLPIESPFFLQDGQPLMVRVPEKEDMLGDKLTAFGPNTLGIPYYKEDRNGQLRCCSLEIIKQLFDIGRLFDAVDDFTNAYMSFKTATSSLCPFSTICLKNSNVFAVPFQKHSGIGRRHTNFFRAVFADLFHGCAC